MPTGNDDAIDVGATEGTMLLDSATVSEGGTTEVVSVYGKAATEAGGTIAPEGFATIAVVSTNGVDIDKFIITGI